MLSRPLFLLLILIASSCGQPPKVKTDMDSLNVSELTSQKNKWLEARSILSRIDSIALLLRGKKEIVKIDSVLPPIEENMDLMIKQATITLLLMPGQFSNLVQQIKIGLILQRNTSFL